MNENLKNIILYLIIIIASIILGTCIIFSAKLVSHSIEINSVKLRHDLVDDIKALQEAKEIKPKEFKPGEKVVEGVVAGSNPIKGNPAAPVLMVEFSDFECPFSKRFYQQVFPQIEKEYISTGKVKFAYRDFPLPMHPFAKEAAIASRCAGKQNNYWQMFDKLSRNNQIDRTVIQNYSNELKLNQKSFDKCLDDQAISAEVEKDLAEGSNFGVQGTPVFFINGRLVGGARSFEVFKEIIEKELNNSEGKK